MYQSHRQRYHSYAMSAPPPLRRLHSDEEGGTAALTRSLNQAFYTTSYQSNITKYAGTWATFLGLLTFLILRVVIP